MNSLYFAAASAGENTLGVTPQAFIIQLVTFLFVFLLLKRFAFKPIARLLETRRKTIDDGVRMGLRMEKEKAKLDAEVAKILRDARHEGDQIIANSHKEAREVIREAEKTAQRKVDAMLADAEVRIEEEQSRARRHLEKDLVQLVSEATETIVGEKVDAKRDAELVKRAMKGSK